MKKLIALLMTVFFLGSTGLVWADGGLTGRRVHKPYVKHHKKGKKGAPPVPTGGTSGMENRVNN